MVKAELRRQGQGASSERGGKGGGEPVNRSAHRFPPQSTEIRANIQGKYSVLF